MNVNVFEKEFFKHDGWSAATIETTWPTGATSALVNGLAEAGVRIAFSQE